jgi:hypothetical protein
MIELLSKKFVTELSKIWVSDPVSEIREKTIPDPGSGSRGQKGTGSRIRIRNTDFEDTFTSFYKDKRSKRSHKTVGIKVFLTIFA